ncbi:UNVERIFIED_CONTAM: class I SAM-dependent methyltransferase [Kocuria sp. CPCC 205316]|uniref:class I SAM-dependent methyltransferase n=1 Tax=Kocuria TaxID=57493 RepID=UPI0036DC607A
MGARIVAERHRWAVEQLGLHPASRVLEFGCGGGVAAQLVLGRLSGGSMLAIDRSATAVARAVDRNRMAVDAGVLTVRRVALADLDAPAESFDVAFGVDVNLFWTTSAEPELSVLRQVLVPGGTLLVAYGPGPRPDRRAALLEPVRGAVAAHGFADAVVLEEDRGGGVRARAGAPRRAAAAGGAKPAAM